MSEQASHKDSVTHWWEFYVVRYAMGTVVGASVVLFLCLSRPEIQVLFLGTSASTALSLEASRLILLAVYGLIYCYIASAPILVFHAGRFLLEPDCSGRKVLRSVSLWSIAPVLCAAGGYWTALHHDISGIALFTAAVLGLALLLELEVAFVYLSIARSPQLFEFYERLGKRRAAAKGEIVESYRHLREHGNSFFIVFLEIALAVVLYESEKLSRQYQHFSPAVTMASVAVLWLAILVVWIMPAVFVWLIGTIFERRFADGHNATRVS